MEIPFLRYLFNAKAVGLSIVGNDLIVSKVWKRGHVASYESLRLSNFLVRHPAEFEPLVEPLINFSKSIILSWPRSKTVVRETDLPNLKIEEFKESLAFQLDTFLPFKPEDVYYDVFPSRHEGKATKVFIAGAKKEELDAVLERLKALGLSPSCVIFTPLALLSLTESVPGGVAYINKENGYYHYSLYVDGFLHKTLLLHGYEDIPSLLEADRPGQIRTLGADAMPSDSQNQSPGKITCLEETTESVGAGVFTPEAALYSFSLTGTRKKILDIQVALCIILSLFLVTLSFVVPYLNENRKTRKLEHIGHEIASLKDKVKGVQILQSQLAAQEMTLGKLEVFTANYISNSDVLLELTKILHDDAWITRYRFEHGHLTVEGVAPSATSLIPLLEASPLFESVALSSPVVKTREGKERFKITLSVSKPARQT